MSSIKNFFTTYVSISLERFDIFNNSTVLPSNVASLFYKIHNRVDFCFHVFIRIWAQWRAVVWKECVHRQKQMFVLISE